MIVSFCAQLLGILIFNIRVLKFRIKKYFYYCNGKQVMKDILFNVMLFLPVLSALQRSLQPDD